MTNIEEEEANRGTETILFTSHQVIRLETNFFFFVYMFVQAAGDMVCQAVCSYFIITAYSKSPLNLSIVAIILYFYHIWKLLFNTLFMCLYGNRVPELKKTYLFAMTTSLGMIIIYWGLAGYLDGKVNPTNLKYYAIPHVVLAFLKLFIGHIPGAPQLSRPFIFFFESIQILYIALKLASPENYASWGWSLSYYYLIAFVALAVALIVLILTTVAIVLFFKRHPIFIGLPTKVVFVILAFGFYLIWNFVAYYLLVSGFHLLLEAGKISPTPAPGAPSPRLLVAAWLILISSILSLIILPTLYCLFRDHIVQYFKDNKPREISLLSFAKSLQMNVNQVNDNYFKVGDVDEEAPFVQKQAELCLVCSDKPIDVLIDPCGHGCLCEECAKEYLKRSSVCPMCKQRMEKIYLIFQDPEKKRFLAKGVIKVMQ